MILKHRKHHSTGTFEIDPPDDCDVYLQYWWTAKPQLSRSLTNKGSSICFDSTRCKEHCTLHQATSFPIDIDTFVVHNSKARINNYVSIDPTSEHPLALLPQKLRQFAGFMGQEAADKLPDHKPYNHAIDVKKDECSYVARSTPFLRKN